MRLRLTILISLVVVFAAVIILFGGGGLNLGGSAGDSPLDTKEFVAAYVELAVLAESMPIGTPEYSKERERVLGAIGITPTQVEETLAYYNQRPDLWRPIWEDIQTKLSLQLDDLNAPAVENDSTTATSP